MRQSLLKLRKITSFPSIFLQSIFFFSYHISQLMDRSWALGNQGKTDNYLDQVVGIGNKGSFQQKTIFPAIRELTQD